MSITMIQAIEAHFLYSTVESVKWSPMAIHHAIKVYRADQGLFHHTPSPKRHCPQFTAGHSHAVFHFSSPDSVWEAVSYSARALRASVA